MLKEILEEIDEIKGNKDPMAKKQAKEVSKAKHKIKRSRNTTPSKVKTSGAAVKFKCTPKDKVKARKMSKVRKKFNKTADAKKAVKKTVLTKKFRN